MQWSACPCTPRYAGAKRRPPSEQLAPAARLAAQVFCVRLKGAVAVRVSELAAEPPVLVTFTVCAALDCPGAMMGKTSCAGLTLSPAEVCPVPVSGTLTGCTPEVEEETASEAVLPPAAAGVKITCTVQLLAIGQRGAAGGGAGGKAARPEAR